MAGDGLTAPSDGGARLSGTPPSGRSGQGRFALPFRKRGRSVRDTGGADPRATASAGAATEPAQQTKAAGAAERTTKVAVPVTTAVLGGEAQVPTITGSVRLKIPETTQSGQVFRLKGHGMPSVGKPDQRGDLYATVEVQLPRSLTKEQRQQYEALAKLER